MLDIARLESVFPVGPPFFTVAGGPGKTYNLRPIQRVDDGWRVLPVVVARYYQWRMSRYAFVVVNLDGNDTIVRSLSPDVNARSIPEKNHTPYYYSLNTHTLNWSKEPVAIHASARVIAGIVSSGNFPPGHILNSQSNYGGLRSNTNSHEQRDDGGISPRPSKLLQTPTKHVLI